MALITAHNSLSEEIGTQENSDLRLCPNLELLWMLNNRETTGVPTLSYFRNKHVHYGSLFLLQVSIVTYKGAIKSHNCNVIPGKATIVRNNGNYEI